MNRRAVAKLVALPFVHMAAGMPLVVAVWLISLLSIPFLGLAATVPWP